MEEVAVAINWVWQGCAVAAAAAVVLCLLQRAQARARYVTAWTALVLVLALPLVPLIVAPGAVPGVGSGSPREAAIVIPDVWWTSATTLAAAWLTWVVVCGTRLCMAMRALRRAQRGSRPFPRKIERRLTHWTRLQENGRPARLCLSDEVRAAAVLMGRRPVVAVHPALLTQLSPDDLDRVIVHEWTHVQRYDDVVQLVQLATRIVAGWHPAVWWLDRRVHVEREMACDEAVVAITGGRREYAASLAAMASLPRVRPLPVVGIVSTPVLAQRVRRIVSGRRLLPARWSLAAAAVCVASMAVVTAGVSAIRAVGAPVFQAVLADIRLGRTPQLEPLVADDPGTAAVPDRPVRRIIHSPSTASDVSEPERQSVSADVVEWSPTLDSDMIPDTTAAAGPVAAVPEDVAILPLTSGTPSSFGQATDAVQIPSGSLPTTTPELLPSPWRAAADAGVAISHGSKKAGVATAGFFSRLGRQVAGSF